MRPEVLFPLYAPPTSLTGVGPRLAALIEKVAGGAHVVDLLWVLPTGLVDRRAQPQIAHAVPGKIATIKVQVDDHLPPRTKRLPYKVRVSDESGGMVLVFFNGREDYLKKTLPIGETRYISGVVEDYQGVQQMTHPDHILTEDELGDVPLVEPVYPLTAGLTSKVMLKAVRGAVALAPELEEWLDPAFAERHEWAAWRTAIFAAHGPQAEDDLLSSNPVRQRLAYDELLANQLALAMMRMHMRKQAGRALNGTGAIKDKIRSALLYMLTGSQETSLAEIERDLEGSERMLRLLQGDVGSGKTVVAFLAMAHAVEAGAQAALMAPTEILARQHFATIEPLARASGLRVARLTGRDKGTAREEILDGLKSGAIDMIVGTHALFQETVEFKDLGFTVIDEQHRFGVHQRLALGGKGRAVDVLVMTATPIPRTLTLTAYGDMDVSRLTEKPAGRKPVKTAALPLTRLNEVVEAVRREIASDGQVYWVCPLVEESEVVDAAAAEERFAHLSTVFGETVGLVHGRMKGPEKDAVMEDFKSGKKKVLVATTVIEVGVDVPQANVMVVEHAERFGLAQLHQLRGRVGRGSAEGSCLLLYQAPLGETAKARIKILRETDDGFIIAEEDLRLRGAGELLGTRQSGMPTFRIADVTVHGDLLAAARDDAALILHKDPELSSARGKALRTLLYLFGRDEAVRYLKSG
jgi:ATP-dependent DNA helicase RecG